MPYWPVPISSVSLSFSAKNAWTIYNSTVTGKYCDKLTFPNDSTLFLGEQGFYVLIKYFANNFLTSVYMQNSWFKQLMDEAKQINKILGVKVD